MALTQIKWIRAIGLSFLRDQKRKEEKEEEKKKRREEERKIQRYGTMTMSMDYLDFLYGYMFVGCGL